MHPRTYGYLAQDIAHETPIANGSTVRDFIYSGTGLDKAIATSEDLSLRIATAEGDTLETLLQHFEQAQNTLEQLGYYDADARCRTDYRWSRYRRRRTGSRSINPEWGDKTKLALVRLLLQDPELLLLDEPTNFLDVEATMWLMEFLESYRGALLIISHDLDLLDRSINKILRLNEFTHKLEEYKGTYSHYLEAIGDAEALLEKTKKQQEREIVRLKKTSIGYIRFGATRVKQRIALDKRVATLEESKPQIQQQSRRMKIDFPVKQRSGQLVVRAEHLDKSYGSKEIFRNISFQVDRGERLVIVGLNGVGKSTLIRTILNLTHLNSGKIPWVITPNRLLCSRRTRDWTTATRS